MGYTHYFTIFGRRTAEWQEAWSQIIRDAPLILEASDVLITGPVDDNKTITPPIIDNDKGIWFNGVADDSHEPLWLSSKHRGLNFVKTLQKPYDLAVACLLLRAYHIAPKNFKLRSDGHWGEEWWMNARLLYQQLWPKETIRCPWEKTGRASLTNHVNFGRGNSVASSQREKTIATLTTSSSVNQTSPLLENSRPISSPQSQLRTVLSTVSNVDFLPIHDWLALCDQDSDHPQCKAPALQWRQLPEVQFRVIDIERMCIVEAQHQCSFIALTYVWGGINQPRLTAETTPLLMQENGLEAIWSQIPTTIRDAIAVCQSLGERYLWVDALCIAQDSERDMKLQILRMRQIYSSAKCTIAAVSSDSADTGLLGTTPMRYGEPCKTVEDLEELLELAPWSSRAWCYQEKVLSHRAIMFTSSGVYMQCQRGVCNAKGAALGRRSGTKGSEVARFNSVGGMLSVTLGEELLSYVSAVEFYSKRRLTTLGDKMNAFQGIFQRYRGIMDGNPTSFCFGLPIFAFDQTFCWRSRRHNPNSRNHSFPSWSWLGWEGAILFDRRIVQGAPTRQIIYGSAGFWNKKENAEAYKLRKPASYSVSGVGEFGFPAGAEGRFYNHHIRAMDGSLANLRISTDVFGVDGSNGLYSVFATNCCHHPPTMPPPCAPTITDRDLPIESSTEVDYWNAAMEVVRQPLQDLQEMNAGTPAASSVPVSYQVKNDHIGGQHHSRSDCGAKTPLGFMWLDQDWRAQQGDELVMEFMALAGEKHDQNPDEWIITMLMCLRVKDTDAELEEYERVQVMDCRVSQQRWLESGAITTPLTLV